MLFVTIICILVVAVVIGLSLLTTSKGYDYKHTVDPLPEDRKDEIEDKTQQS